jgi:two-component system, cell cycle response regulator DivK
MAHILIIEDDHDNREMAELILRTAGHAVSSTGDAISGMRMAAHTQPDLILMDLALPRVDGWSATRRLKAYPPTRRIPVVAFTAHTTSDATARARTVGCVAIVAKPFELDVFLNQIADVLREHAPRYRHRRSHGTRGVPSSAASRLL